MTPFLAEHYGNPSSGHWAGAPAAQAVAHARAQIAELLGCSPEEVVFTSGGTESNNAALLGAFWAAGEGRRHIVTTRIEHPAIIEPCHFLERLGAEVTYVGVDSHGLVDPDDVAAAMRPDTILVSVMHANNEVGTIQPIAEIARITRDAGVLLHSDAAQSVGKIATQGGRARRGPALPRRAQVLRPQGRRRALRPRGHEAGAAACTAPATRRADAPARRTCCSTSASALPPSLPRDLTWTEGVRELRDWFWDELRTRWGERVVLNGHPDGAPAQHAERELRRDARRRHPGRAAGGGRVHRLGVPRRLGHALAGARGHGRLPRVGMGAIRFSLGR